MHSSLSSLHLSTAMSETPPTVQQVRERSGTRAFYWLAAAAQTIAAALDVKDGDQLKTAAQFSLALALVLLASAGPEQSRFLSFITYLALAAAIGLLIARVMAG
jgi:hypothetical protein